MVKLLLIFTASLRIVTSIYIMIHVMLNISKSIVFSQTLIKRISSRKSNLDSPVKELKKWFSIRGYLEKVISEQVSKRRANNL